MTRNAIVISMALLFSLFLASAAGAEELSAQLCKDKVIAAAKVVEAEGDASFPKFRDENGEFRFGGGKGYIWIHNLDGIMLMHPIKASLEGKNLTDLADANGVYLFVAMNETVEEHGKGWIPYVWPKPGDKDASPKISYCYLVSKGGVDYVIGSGMYDVTAEDIKKMFPGDAVYED